MTEYICPFGERYNTETEECEPIPPWELPELPPIYEIESFFLNPIVGPLSLFHLSLLLTAGYVVSKKTIVKDNKLIVLIVIIGVAILLYVSLSNSIDSTIDNLMGGLIG